MPPLLADVLLVVTDMRSETSNKACRKLRVSREMLSNMMHQLHQNGITVVSVRGTEGGIEPNGQTVDPQQSTVSETKPTRRRKKSTNQP